jgi:hypothetical protein
VLTGLDPAVKLETLYKKLVDGVTAYKSLRSHLEAVENLSTTPLEATLPINTGLGPSYTQTVLPWISPGEFEAAVQPASGMTNVQTTTLPLLPDVPRRAYVQDAAGVVTELYVRDDETGEIHPAYINPIAIWEGKDDA